MTTKLCIAFLMGFSLTQCALEESPLSRCGGVTACAGDFSKDSDSSSKAKTCSAYRNFFPCLTRAGENCKISKLPQFTDFLQGIKTNCTTECSQEECGITTRPGEPTDTDEGTKNYVGTDPDYTDTEQVPPGRSHTGRSGAGIGNVGQQRGGQNIGGAGIGNAGQQRGGRNIGDAGIGNVGQQGGSRNIGSAGTGNVGPAGGSGNIGGAGAGNVRPAGGSGNAGGTGTGNVGPAGGSENAQGAGTGSVGSAGGKGNVRGAGITKVGSVDGSGIASDTGTGSVGTVDGSGDARGAGTGSVGSADDSSKEGGTTSEKTGVRGASEKNGNIDGGEHGRDGKEKLIMKRGMSMKDKASGADNSTSLAKEPEDPSEEPIPTNGTDKALRPNNSAPATTPMLMLVFTVVACVPYTILPTFL